MNLEQYMNRIHLTNFRELHGIELLKAIHTKHLLHIPFENLDLMNGIPLSMDAEHVFNKVVKNKRGGLCFELNSLLYSVLETLGFHVSYLSGQFWNADKQTWNPECSHLALLVQLDERYLFDVGVGDGFLEPLHLKANKVYSDISGTYRFIEASENDSLILQKENESGEWEKMFKVSLLPRHHNQFEPLLQELQEDESSIFKQKKMCSKATSDGRISLTEEALTITKNGVKTKHPLSTEREWKTLLFEHFGISE